MLRKLINTYLEQNIKDENSVAILFSGGLDSLSILLSCMDLGMRPHLYTFRLSNYVSEDYLHSKNIANIYNLKFTEIILDTNTINLKSDIELMMKMFDVRKKTQIQCIHPFLYVIPKIRESYILSGLCADDLYGTPRSMAKHAKDTDCFNRIRENRFSDDKSSSYRFIRDLIHMYDKEFIVPYKQSKEIYKYMISKSYKDLNSPKQKYIMYCDYSKELIENNLYRRNSNLQCNSKIREWHDELLKDKELNTRNLKSVVGVYNDIYNKIIEK